MTRRALELAVVVLAAVPGCRQLLGIDSPVDLVADASSRDAARVDGPGADAPRLDAPRDAAVNVPMYIQGAASTQLGQNNHASLNLPDTVMANDLLVVSVGVATEGPIISVKDSLESSYTAAVPPFTFDQGATAMYFATAGTAGSDAISVSVQPQGGATVVLVADYRATLFVGSAWQAATPVSAGGDSSDPAVDVDVTGAGLVVAAESSVQGTGSAGTGFTERVSSTGGLLEDEAVDAAAPVDASATLSVSQDWVIEAAAFRVE